MYLHKRITLSVPRFYNLLNGLINKMVLKQHLSVYYTQLIASQHSTVTNLQLTKGENLKHAEQDAIMSWRDSK